jgi:hypothetical protein
MKRTNFVAERQSTATVDTSPISLQECGFLPLITALIRTDRIMAAPTSTDGSATPPVASPTKAFRTAASPGAAPSAPAKTEFSLPGPNTSQALKAVKSLDFTAFCHWSQESIKPVRKSLLPEIRAPRSATGINAEKKSQVS